MVGIHYCSDITFELLYNNGNKELHISKLHSAIVSLYNSSSLGRTVTEILP